MSKMDDMTVPCGEGLINLRAGAVIVKNGRILMVESPDFGYLYSVGGRIRFGETSEQAVVREVFEETGEKLETDGLAFTHECYYICDAPKYFGKTVYEITFYYYMKVPEDFDPVKSGYSEEGTRERLVWADFDDIRTMYPAFFRTEIAVRAGIKHFIDDDRNK